MALRALVAAQLVAILVCGVATVARFPVWALVDERAHYDYVQTVAEEGRLPVLRRDLISPEAEAIDEGTFPRPGRRDPRDRGLAGQSYEAFQPPLYYVVAAPVFRLPFDHLDKVYVLRALGLLLLAGTIALIWLLAREVAPAAPLAAFSVALTVFLWPGVLVRAITVSNAGLELLLGAAILLALWRAHARGDPRWLVAAGALTGAGLLTRWTVFPYALLLAGVAVVLVRRGAASLRSAALAVVLPVALLAPWFAFNLHHYDALTATGVARDMQEHVVNPTGHEFTAGELPDRSRSLLNGVLAEEWWSEFLSSGKRAARDVFGLLFLALPVGLAVWRRVPPRAVALLALPLAIAIAWANVATIAANWNLIYPRYLYATLPAFGLFAAVALRRQRAMLAYSGAASLVLVAVWIHLAGVRPFAP